MKFRVYWLDRRGGGGGGRLSSLFSLLNRIEYHDWEEAERSSHTLFMCLFLCVSLCGQCGVVVVFLLCFRGVVAGVLGAQQTSVSEC